MDKTEAIAGLLSTLHGTDRRWILRSLPEMQRRRLRLAMKHLPSDVSKLREEIQALIRPSPIRADITSDGDVEVREARRRMATSILVDLPRDLQNRIRIALGLVDEAGQESSLPTTRARAALIRHLPSTGRTHGAERSV